MQVIDPAAWRAQPWRNGAGVTHELLRWPAAEPFAIRISVADVSAPAPFSAFPGYQRWLYLLEGGPVTLEVEGAEVRLADPGDGLAFSGAAPAAAVAVTGPSRDLNFMVQETRAAKVHLLRGEGRHALAGAAVAVFVIAVPVAVVVDGGGGEVRSLGRHDLAWGADGSRAVTVELGPGGVAAALVVE